MRIYFLSKFVLRCFQRKSRVILFISLLIMIYIVFIWRSHTHRPNRYTAARQKLLQQKLLAAPFDNTVVKTFYKATDMTYGLLTFDDYFSDWYNYSTPTCDGGYRCRFKETPKGADAVIFQSSHVNFAPLAELQKARTPKQRWIFFSWESPVNGHVPINGPWRFRFNWTATFMLRSDIYAPYSLGYRPARVPQKEISFKSKYKMAFAAISNCKAPERLKLIAELQKYIDVDVYGKCGPFRLPLGFDKVVELSRSYKFYFSFENSQCTDYLTEKFWKNAMLGYSVPVILGGFGRADVQDVAPPNSIIHFRDFKTVEEMANFLIALSKDEPRYQSYLAWKQKYEIIDKSHAKILLCNICQHLHTDFKPSVKDLNKEWDIKKFCHSSSVRTVFNKTYHRIYGA